MHGTVQFPESEKSDVVGFGIYTYMCVAISSISSRFQSNYSINVDCDLVSRDTCGSLVLISAASQYLAGRTDVPEKHDWILDCFG